MWNSYENSVCDTKAQKLLVAKVKLQTRHLELVFVDAAMYGFGQ